MIRLLLAVAAALALGATAAAQTAAPQVAPPALRPPAPPPQLPDGAAFWTRSPERMTLGSARISFPTRAGEAVLSRSVALGPAGEGLDNALLYRSEDGALIATAYVYLPGLAHSGLAALVSDHFVRLQSGPGLRLLARRVVGAAGREGVAIRVDYAGFREDGQATGSAFMRAGRWIVKLRVTGPESRRAEVERTLAALLDGVRFEGSVLPRPAAPIDLVDCPPVSAAPRAALHPARDADAAEDAIMAVADGLDGEASRPGPPPRDRPSGIGRLWCVSSVRRIGALDLPILRIPPSEAGEDSRRSVAFAILNDSGGALEVVERRFSGRSRYILIHHATGRTRVLGSYDGLPDDAQLLSVIDGSDAAGGRARASIAYRASGDSEITVLRAPGPTSAATGGTP